MINDHCGIAVSSNFAFGLDFYRQKIIKLKADRVLFFIDPRTRDMIKL